MTSRSTAGGALRAPLEAAASASGPLPLWPAVFAVWGNVARTSLHAHHAWHLMVGLDGPLLVRDSARGRAKEAEAFLTRPDVPHAADGNGHRVAVIFVVPETGSGARLAARGAGGIEILAPRTVGPIRAALAPARDPEQLRDGAVRALSELGVEDTRPPFVHPGVRKVLRTLREGGAARGDSLEALAALSGLSPSRFMHVFTRDVGIPLRPYLRWLRVERATNAFTAGAPLSEAAAVAGFSDAAHMARSVRAMLGMTPSALLRSQSVQAG